MGCSGISGLISKGAGMVHVHNRSCQMPTVAPGNCNGKPGRHGKAQKGHHKRGQEELIFIRNATKNKCLFLLRKIQNTLHTLIQCGCKKIDTFNYTFRGLKTSPFFS